jgi:hypothetical protein
LEYHELGQYSELFRKEGYKWSRDMANMKDLKADQLKAMGIKKRGTVCGIGGVVEQWLVA